MPARSIVLVSMKNGHGGVEAPEVQDGAKALWLLLYQEIPRVVSLQYLLGRHHLDGFLVKQFLHLPSEGAVELLRGHLGLEDPQEWGGSRVKL